MMSGNISVPIYANVNGKTAKYILEHSESVMLFLGKLEEDDWNQMKNYIPKNIEKVDYGFYNLDSNFTKWDSIISEYKPTDKVFNISLNDIITIIYTSGTTGIPKGVVLNYKAAATATKNLDLLFPLNENDRFISYLPLSHIAERALVEHGGILSG